MGQFDLAPIISKKRRRRVAPTDKANVYFMENRDTGTIKIGATKRLARRAYEVKDALGTADGERAYLGYFEVDASLYRKLETAMHKRFAAYRASGEWFSGMPKGWTLSARRVAEDICGTGNFRVAGLVEVEPEEEQQHMKALEKTPFPRTRQGY